MRKGFTIAELMVAAFVTGIVVASVGTTFIVAARVLSTAMTESELALGVRQLRERLLFRAAPTVNGAVGAGLLSGRGSPSPLEGGATPNIQMDCKALGATFGDVRDQSMRIMLRSEGASRYLFNERATDKDRHRGWLRPGGFSLADASIADVVGYESSSVSPADIFKVTLDINLGSGSRIVGGEAVRRERITVPVMGKAQPMKDSEGRY